MKVDISDAPERVIRKRHKGRGFYPAICLAIGSMATIGALLTLNPSPSLDSLYKLQPMNSTEANAGRLGAVDRLPSPGLDPARLQVSPGLPQPPDAPRQTVFNDQNFTPRGAANVVSLRVGGDPAPRKAPSKGANVTIVGQSPSMKDRACWPYRQGSIESRNCRASIGLKYRD